MLVNRAVVRAQFELAIADLSAMPNVISVLSLATDSGHSIKVVPVGTVFTVCLLRICEENYFFAPRLSADDP